jgi:hypothetical protein
MSKSCRTEGSSKLSQACALPIDACCCLLLSLTVARSYRLQNLTSARALVVKAQSNKSVIWVPRAINGWLVKPRAVGSDSQGLEL